MGNNAKLYLGVLLASLATLALQVLQVRIFSVMLWHHLAYMVITVTLLGFGAAGAYVAVKGTGETEEEAKNKAGWAALLAAISTIFGFAIVTRIPLDTYMESSNVQLGFIFIYYAFLVVPYFFLGLTITILLTRFTEIIHRLYFWNLLGSAIGCVVFLGLLITLGGEGSIFAIAAIAALAAVPIFASKKLSVSSLVIAAIMLALIPVSTIIVPVMPAPSKALGGFHKYTKNLKVESVTWDPVARIDVVSSPEFANMLRYHEAEVKKIFTIDGDAFTFFYGWNKPLDQIKSIGQTLYGSAYFFKDKPKVAMIGLGGGTDVVTALHFNSTDVTAVEINQAMIDAAMTSFNDYPIHPYKDPRVKIIHEEGRSFLRRVDDKYDIIQMSGVDTWSALATGAYVLSENYLYTKNAFREYYNHLNEDGIMSMIRWLFDPPRECLRLVTTQSEVLRERGVKKPWNHIIVLKQELLASVITKMRPFSKSDIDKLNQVLKQKPGMEIVYAPGVKGNNAFYRYFEALRNDKESLFIDQYPFKLSSVDDNRPFFFEFYKWDDTFKNSFGKGGYLIATKPTGYIILIASLIQAFILGLFFILIPLWKFKRKGLVMDKSKQMIAYFAALGIGFMFVEVSLMQKFVLFLGHPTYSITVTLFTLLTFSGIGSFIAGKFTAKPQKIIFWATMAIAAVVGVYAFVLTPLFNALLGLPIMGRMITSVVLLAPLGILMGMPFPTGLSYMETGARSFVPWAFGINGVASVVASILCIIIALFGGFNLVLTCAIVIYASAGLVMSRFKFSDSE